MQRLAGAVLLAFVAVVALFSARLDRQDEAMMARAAWEGAATLNQPSVAAKTFLCRIERHKGIILADGIASADSFQAVQSRLNALWDAYCWLYDGPTENPAAAGMATLGEM